MKTSLLIETDGWIIATILLIAMISCAMLGVRVANRKKKRNLALASGGKVGDTNYLTGLFFFLLAFTFGMSGSRFAGHGISPKKLMGQSGQVSALRHKSCGGSQNGSVARHAAFARGSIGF